MESILFDYHFGDNTLRCEAEIEPGEAARIDCAPEDAVPGHGPSAGIVSCNILTVNESPDANVVGSEFYPEELYEFNSRTMKSEYLLDALEAAAIQAWEDDKC